MALISPHYFTIRISEEAISDDDEMKGLIHDVIHALSRRLTDADIPHRRADIRTFTRAQAALGPELTAVWSGARAGEDEWLVAVPHGGVIIRTTGTSPSRHQGNGFPPTYLYVKVPEHPPVSRRALVEGIDPRDGHVITRII